MEEREEMKKEYEISFLGADENISKKVEDVLSSHNAEIIFRGAQKEIKLSYPIQKKLSAYFNFFHFKSAPDQISQIRTALNLKEDVLRFLILTPPIPLQRKRSVEVEQGALPKTIIESIKPRELTNEALEEKLEEILK